MVDETLIDALRGILDADRVATGPSIRDERGRDESWYTPAPPDVVVFPESTDEVAAVVRRCAADRVPIVPYGAGTSVEGHVLALQGGVTIDMSRMNRVLDVQHEDLDATVEAGVTRLQLNDALKTTGLFFPIDPGADASLGGMAATRASGTNAVRYGTMRENVMALTVVLSDGRVLKTGTRARKSSAGYDLTRLFVGSEGTLGVITEVTVRLHGVPESITSAVCPFEGIDGAVQSVIETIQLGVPVARIELLDEAAMRAVNAFSDLDYEIAPTLFYEFHGTDASTAEQAATAQEIAGSHGAGDFRWATRNEEREKLWQARHDAYFASLAVRPGARVLSTDVCVPISRLAECIGGTRDDLQSFSLPTTLVGHVGDGNFHLLILIDPNAPAEITEARAFNERLVRRALGLGGTCTGEHGIGMGKREWLVEEHGADAVELMRQLKRTLDPHDLMNPGKIFLPETAGA